MRTAIDIGNTNVNVGFFEGSILSESLIFSCQTWHELYRQFAGRSLGDCIVSSVIPVPEHVVHYLRSKARRLLVLDKDTPLPIKSSYHSPDTLGMDRLCLATGAASLHSGRNILIVSAGTCITYNFLSSTLQFLGGAISPGLNMRFQALNQFTARLPLVEPDNHHPIIGMNTEESIRSGVVNGILFEIKGYAQSHTAKYKDLIIMLSGGDSRYLEPKLSLQIHLEPDLALLGLIKILEFNADKKL